MTQQPLKLQKKIIAIRESEEFFKFFNVRFTKFKTNQIVLKN